MAVPKILLVGATVFILDDLDLLERVARDYDIVVHCADGFHRSSGEALVKGLGQRQMETGKKTYFIRTSGVSGIADRPLSGRYIETCELSDKDSIYAYEQHRETMESYPSRQADVAIVDAGERANVNTYIIMSPLIYGRGNGLFNTRSMQIPSIIRSAREWGYVGYVGNGSGEWDHVHVLDLAALYELLLAKIVSGVEIPSGKAGIFFSAAGRHSWRALANSIATAGVKLGLLRSDEAKEISIEQAAAAWAHGMDDFVEPGFGSRATTRADLAKELGWEPKKTDTDWQETFLDEWES
ncbi:hypothetical protein CEP51_005868 [Fusarium floridanum]|uniref:NAD-dependent epimerase/dehydratase domain-containing protein n=1 Tax=Fusarium floridanum TaxID=1325733 RepID=A0A428RV27_9HYPO|nr:hypothetical protein CEP51_005868 [Fusarium floridanum]